MNDNVIVFPTQATRVFTGRTLSVAMSKLAKTHLVLKSAKRVNGVWILMA